MKPTQLEMRKIDELVEALDREQIPETIRGRATARFVVIFAEWDQFQKLVGQLDQAMRHPFASGAARKLLSASELVGDITHRLSFRLAHVGEAIRRR